MRFRHAALAAALAVVWPALALAQDQTPGLQLKDANAATQTEGAASHGGVLIPFHGEWVVDGSGVWHPELGDSAGRPTVNVNGTVAVSAVSLPLPTGAASAANQPALNGDGGALAHVTNFPATQPVSAVSLPLPTGAALETGGNLAAAKADLDAISAAAAASATAVNQTAVQAIAGSNSSKAVGVQGVAGGVAVKVDGSAVTQPVSGTFWQATQPVSVASLPLPSGAAQESGGHLAAIDASTAATATDIGAPGSTACATDNGSCNANALIQRLNQRITSLISAVGSPLQAGGSVGLSGTLPGFASTPAFTISGTLPAFAATPTVNAAENGTWSVGQSGTWTVQPGNTANTTPWLFTINQGGNAATVSVAGALKVDGSAITQPISAASLPLPSGAATAAAQPALNGDGGALAHVTNFPATQPISAAATNAVGSSTGALVAGVVICSSACKPADFHLTPDATLSASTWFVMIEDATAIPADGATSNLLACYQVAAGVLSFGGTFPSDAGLGTTSSGAVAFASTTGCSTKTGSTHLLFARGSHY